MSARRSRKRPAGRATASTPPPHRASKSAAATPISRARYAAFLAITLLLPVVLLGLAELALRLAQPQGGIPVFVTAPGGRGDYLIANPRLARRYFANERFPPVPQPEPFARVKPARAFRLFVLGESTTAGFPFPRNGTFTRVLRDVLRDVLPDDSIEVVNLGIAATNSYAVDDIAEAVLDQRPDAVLLYAGHNEFYGALGVGSSERVGAASPLLVRSYLGLERLRLFLLLRDGLSRLRRSVARTPPPADAAASFMETLGRDQEIALGSTAFARGVDQFESNLRRIVARMRRAGVPVLVGSLTSNVRDQPPFASASNAVTGGAADVFRSARAALSAGDTARARVLFPRARDLDVVRFRAPSAFNDIVRRVASENSGAVYVPVEEAFASASRGKIPGGELFLEHVHPTRDGYVLLARTYFEALRGAGFMGRQAQLARARSWDAYAAGMELTPFDERIAHHTVRTIVARWPFVPRQRQLDYRGTYHPSGVADSLALLVSRGGMRWEVAKLQVAADFEARGAIDSAIAEYRGLERDLPLAELPLRLHGRALLAANRDGEADVLLRRAIALEPTASGAFALGMIAVRRKNVAEAIRMLELSLRIEPNQAPALFQLSLAYGLARDLDRARATARQLVRIDPRFPGLAGWLRVLELSK